MRQPTIPKLVRLLPLLEIQTMKPGLWMELALFLFTTMQARALSTFQPYRSWRQPSFAVVVSNRRRPRSPPRPSIILTRIVSSTRRFASSSSSSSSSSSAAPSDGGRTISRLPPVPQNCHRFVLMRHGQSSFNDAAIFTGWCDVALTRRGVVEALEAGEVFRSHNLQFRKCYTSLLTRSIVTAQRCLEAAGVAYTPLELDWRLNERHYGALQGLSKEQTAVRLGRDLVMEWRRSYYARPPLMTDEHPHFHTINADPRYRHLTKQEMSGANNGNSDSDGDSDNNSTTSSASSSVLPRGESLEDCQKRVIDAWKEVLQDLSNNFDESNDFEYTLLVAHANTLRALVMHLDEIDASEIEGLNVPTAIPFFYDIDKSTGRVVMSSSSSLPSTEHTSAPGTFRGAFITDERKKQSFLERRRAANDPWIWALRNDQVATSMLNATITDNTVPSVEELEEEARKNTELFAPGQTDSMRDP